MDILIVEDEPAINHLICMNLQDEGYLCTSAFDGKHAAELIEQNHYDLILLDIMLPGINGYELMEYIRPLQIPVIFITARTDLNDRIRGLKLGADDYIIKPFQIGELLARVEAVLRRFGKVEKKLELFGVIIDLEAREVWKDGKTVELTVPNTFEAPVYRYFWEGNVLKCEASKTCSECGETVTETKNGRFVAVDGETKKARYIVEFEDEDFGTQTFEIILSE